MRTTLAFLLILFLAVAHMPADAQTTPVPCADAAEYMPDLSHLDAMVESMWVCGWERWSSQTNAVYNGFVIVPPLERDAVSPTILIERGYRVVIYRNDHLPAHVHVYKAEAEARVKLEPVELWDSDGFNAREIRRILTIVEAHRAEILEAWNNSRLNR